MFLLLTLHTVDVLPLKFPVILPVRLPMRFPEIDEPQRLFPSIHLAMEMCGVEIT